MTSQPIIDGDAVLIASLQEPEGFTEVQDPVPLDADAGILVTLGVREDGTLEPVDLHFVKENGWTTKTVRSWLAGNGLDADPLHRIRAALGRDAVQFWGTTAAGGTDGHTHQWWLDVWYDEYDEKWRYSWYTSHHEGTNQGHNHEYGSSTETAPELGHTHSFTLPAEASEALQRVGLESVTKAVEASRMDVAARLSHRPGMKYGSDAAVIQDAEVKKDDDWYVIEDNILARSGVYNGILRPAAVFERAWRLYEGVPITHPHPDGIVESLDLVAGMVENVRIEHEGDEVVVYADYRLARHTGIDGLNVTEDMVKLNDETVARVEAGQPVDNSQGYIFTGREKAGDDPAGEYDLVMLEYVPNHLAILLEQVGACSWEQGCGVARAAVSEAIAERFSALPSVFTKQGQERPENNMGHCNECSTVIEDANSKAEKLQEQVEALRPAHAALEKLRDALGLGEESSPAVIEKAAKEALGRLAKIEEAEKKAHKAMALEVAKLAIKAGMEGEEEALAEHYATEYGPAALKEHRSLIKGLTEKPAGRDTTVLVAGKPAGEEAQRLTVGVPKGKGEWRTD